MGKEEILIRSLRDSDKELLLRIMGKNIPAYFDPSERSDFEYYLDNELEDYFVVEQNQVIVAGGGINYQYDTGIARISWDMVLPELQGKGIGKRLLLHRIELIRQNQKIKRIEVRTSQLAHTFYAKAGFKLIKIEKDYWAEGFDLYWMEKRE